MKLSTKQLRSSRLELSMTSMIDVVFLLLIFFIVTTTFVRPEREVVSAIKVNEKRAAAQSSKLEPAIVDVFKQNGEVIFRVGAVKTNELENIKPLLNGYENKSEGAFVRVADNVPFEAAAQAIGACQASGFQTVSYLSFE